MPESQPLSTSGAWAGRTGQKRNKKSETLIKELTSLWVKSSDQSEWGTAVARKKGDTPENDTLGFYLKPLFLKPLKLFHHLT